MVMHGCCVQAYMQIYITEMMIQNKGGAFEIQRQGVQLLAWSRMQGNSWAMAGSLEEAASARSRYSKQRKDRALS